MDTAADEDLVKAAAMDYFGGWYDADAARMDRALHEDLVKRWAGDGDGGKTLGRQRTKAQILELTAAGGGRAQGAVSEQGIEVEVLDVYGHTASVVVRSSEYHEHLHVMRTPDGWKIVDAFWQQDS
jgi:hypothetical protein